MKKSILSLLLACFLQINLAVYLIRDRFFDEGEGIHIFDLRAGAELVVTDLAHRNVDVAAQRTLLHLTVRNADVFHHQLQPLEIFADLVGAANVRLRHDLNERHAAAVVVHIGIAAAVYQLARVLLDVDTRQADLFAGRQLYIAVLAQRFIKLRDLISLGQVGIHIVFAVHLGNGVDGAVGDQPRHDRIAHRLPVELGQRAGQADADRAAVRVRLTAEAGSAAAENFGVGGKLNVSLQTGNHFVIHTHTMPFLIIRRTPWGDRSSPRIAAHRRRRRAGCGLLQSGRR